MRAFLQDLSDQIEAAMQFFLIDIFPLTLLGIILMISMLVLALVSLN